MPRPRTSMHEIREILRLAIQLQLSANEISRATGVSRGKVQDVVRRARAANVEWPVLDDDTVLADRLYPRAANPKQEPPVPSWEKIDAQLRRKGVTLQLLWQEYIREHADGYSYSQFCRRFRRWASQRDLVMRQEHRAGEKMFVDFAGLKFPLTCRFTGEVVDVPVFVAVLGASNYCYAQACASEQLRDWLTVHIRTLRFFGGVPQYVVPDNLKSAVTKARRFDPLLNRSYQRLAEHYGFGILPARPMRPKDKAKVEKGVQVVEQWILAPMRDMTFFTLDDLNQEILRRVEELNNEPFQKLSGCRRTWFENVDAPELKPLPKADFTLEEWDLSVKIPKDYHISVDGHFYSVPYRLVGEIVDIRLTDTTIEAFYRNGRVARHMRNWAEGQKTTSEEHMPAAHAAYQGMSPEKFLEWATAVGPSTKLVISEILRSKPYPQLCFDQCWGILRSLTGKFGNEAVETACGHALLLSSPGYRVVKSILERGIENLPKQMPLELTRVSHPNIRGPNQFQ